MDHVRSMGGPQLRTDRIAARLAPNRGTNGGFSLVVEGTTQSHVNPDDPRDLQLEYVRLIAAVIDALFPPGAPVAVLHLGGGALTLPRYVTATRPGSRQHVVELFAELYEFVVEHLPLHDDTVTAEFADGREAVGRLLQTDQRFDLVVVDVFSGDVAPRHMSTAEFFASTLALLRPGGLVVVNTLATRGLDFSRDALATLRSAFPSVVALGADEVIAGQRVGNIELVAGAGPIAVDALTTALEPHTGPIRVLVGSGLDVLGGGQRRRD